MSRRFLVTYIALAAVVLASLEIPLGIQYGRSERSNLEGRIKQDALTMATFAEDTLERGLTKPPSGLVRVARSYQRSPGGRVVIVDAHGPLAARHEAALPRPPLVRDPPRVRLRPSGAHRHRDPPLEHAQDRPDVRGGADRLRRGDPRCGQDHLPDRDPRRACQPLLAPARSDRRRRAGRGDRRRRAVRAHADETALGARADGRGRRRRRPAGPRTHRLGPARDPRTRLRAQRDRRRGSTR